MSDKERLTALRAGVSAIAHYPRRDCRIAEGRGAWESAYHLTRCHHAFAAGAIMSVTPDEAGALEHMLMRLTNPPLSFTGDTPIVNEATRVATHQVAQIARVALAEAGIITPSIPGIAIPAQFEEETFCALDERFDPLVNLQ